MCVFIHINRYTTVGSQPYPILLFVNMVCQSGAWSQRGTKVSGTRHGDNPLVKPTQGFKSRQNSCQVEPPEDIGTVSASRRCLRAQTTDSTFRSAASSRVFQKQNSNSHKRLDVLPICRCPSADVIKSDSTSFFRNRGAIRRQVMQHFRRNGTDQCQNGSSNLLTPYREQPQSTINR